MVWLRLNPLLAVMSSSAIYECRVMHQRLVPLRHGFGYRVFYLWLDLDEVDCLEKRLWLLSRARFNLFSFYPADHLGGAVADLKQGVLEHLAKSGVETCEIASVRMLAFPRVLGYIFNPVTFFYGFDAVGNAVAAVAQVTNTYHEQKLYTLPQAGADGRFRLITPKHFYVSPFSSLELHFDFQLAVPGEKLWIAVDDQDDEGAKVLVSLLTGHRRPLSDWQLARCAVKYPLLTLKVIFMIHWHALRLWLRKLPVFPKAANANLQTEVLKPHVSIQPRKP
jgi:uncharacterized protein